MGRGERKRDGAPAILLLTPISRAGLVDPPSLRGLDGGIVESRRGGVLVIGWIFGLARILGLGAAAGTRPWLTLAVVG